VLERELLQLKSRSRSTPCTIGHIPCPFQLEVLMASWPTGTLVSDLLIVVGRFSGARPIAKRSILDGGGR
jgi:hypothetical protein